MPLGDEVKKRRIEIGLSRTQLADKCGLNHRWIEQLESGQFIETPPTHTVFQIAQSLKTTTEDLLGLQFDIPKTRTVLMNAAMMPEDGTYIRREISKSDFVSRIREAHHHGILKSYIGYSETARHINKITGVFIQVTRSDTKITKHDHLVVCKLRKRVSDKGETQYPVENDYQYLEIQYKGRESVF